MLLHIHHRQLGWYLYTFRWQWWCVQSLKTRNWDFNRKIGDSKKKICLLRHTLTAKNSSSLESHYAPHVHYIKACSSYTFISELSSSCNLTNILLPFTDWMSNPFDRVVCGDFAGKKKKRVLMQLKMFCFEPFLKNYCAIKISKSIFSILLCCQQTIKRNILYLREIDMGSNYQNENVYRILILTQTPTVKKNDFHIDFKYGKIPCRRAPLSKR